MQHQQAQIPVFEKPRQTPAAAMAGAATGVAETTLIASKAALAVAVRATLAVRLAV
ncbi:MAG TPA: hypothetical protein PLY97_06235 [Acidocella sp.]|nr:hypothetical protein [Acidocella sp.]